MANRESGNRIPLKYTFPTFPKEEEGVKKAFELLDSATIRETPEFPVLEPHMSRLITKPDQIKWFERRNLEKLHLIGLGENISFRLFSLAGISEGRLRKHYIEREYEIFYEDESTNKPFICLNKDFFDILKKDDPDLRLRAGLKIIEMVLEANFNILPILRLVPQEFRRPTFGSIRRSVDLQFHRIALELGNEVEGYKFEATENIIHNLLHEEEPPVNSRAVCFGDTVLWITNSIQHVLAQESHKDVCFYFLEPIFQRALELSVAAGYSSGVAKKVPDEILSRALRGKQRLAPFNLEKRSQMDAYIQSELAVLDLQEKSNIGKR